MRGAQKQSGTVQFAGKRIPLQTVERLSTYRRVLEDLHGQGIQYVYSHQLAEYVDVTSAQLRRDLASFGSFGNISRGYNVGQLINTLSELLGTVTVQPVALVGAGNLGRTLLSYGGFVERGFALDLVFDNDPSKIGRVIAGRRCLDIRDAATALRDRQIGIAILACQPQGLQTIVNSFAEAGVRAFLCFVPAILNAPPGTFIEMEDISAKLEKLSFLGKNRVNPRRELKASGF
ncbi:MAG: redox-sensing transcriptional repressor Rex [Acidobacteriota bacterium]|jgi:redox-sensing transcriptional repressor|nr:redox-sensing transcriptional repressor Rex [Acidobacteriota bacterium]